MIKEESLNKSLYKITLYFIKVIPVVIALCYFIHTILSLLYIEIPVISYIAGTSMLNIMFLYLLSFVFKFCAYHRMFIYYIVVNNILCLYDQYIGIPIESTRGMISFIVILFCLFLFTVLYLYVRSNKELTIKNSR